MRWCNTIAGIGSDHTAAQCTVRHVWDPLTVAARGRGPALIVCHRLRGCGLRLGLLRRQRLVALPPPVELQIAAVGPDRAQPVASKHS